MYPQLNIRQCKGQSRPYSRHSPQSPHYNGAKPSTLELETPTKYKCCACQQIYSSVAGLVQGHLTQYVTQHLGRLTWAPETFRGEHTIKGWNPCHRLIRTGPQGLAFISNRWIAQKSTLRNLMQPDKCHSQ